MATPKYIQHKQIDKRKWDRCVRNSQNSRVYGMSYYLDVVCDHHWDAIVLGDYDAVMPLPYNRKIFGMYQVYHPFFCQQLGVFGEANVSEMLNAIPNKFKLIRSNLNSANRLENASERTNLVIKLDKSHADIVANYSTSLRKRLRKAKDFVVIETEDVGRIVNQYKNRLQTKVKLPDGAYKMAEAAFRRAVENEQAVLLEVELDGNEVASGIFLKDDKRIYNVMASSSPDKQHAVAMSVLLNNIIESHQNTGLTFDFEGSDIIGVRAYFESFGAENEPYRTYTVNRLPFWIKWRF